MLQDVGITQSSAICSLDFYTFRVVHMYVWTLKNFSTLENGSKNQPKTTNTHKHVDKRNLVCIIISAVFFVSEYLISEYLTLLDDNGAR